MNHNKPNRIAKKSTPRNSKGVTRVMDYHEPSENNQVLDELITQLRKDDSQRSIKYSFFNQVSYLRPHKA